MKLLVFDVEGTIFKTKIHLPNTELTSTIWQTLAYMLGTKAIDEEVETHKKWSNGEYKNYIDWMRNTIDIHIKYGLTQNMFETVINKAEYNTGVFDFFNTLNRSKYTPVLISGGFQNLSQRAQIDLKIHHSFTACTYYFKDGKLCGYNLLPSDFCGKVKFLEILCNEYGIPDDEWIFIGDGKNDVAIANKAKVSIGFNPNDCLKKVVTYSISDFREIDKILDLID